MKPQRHVGLCLYRMCDGIKSHALGMAFQCGSTVKMVIATSRHQSVAIKYNHKLRNDEF